MTAFTLSEGSPEPLGASIEADGVNVAVVSTHATAIVVCLFDPQDREIARLPLPGRTGDVFHGRIHGMAAGARYGLRAFGPWDPARGLWFNPARLLADPYAATLDRPFRLHPSLFDGASPGPADSAPFMPKAIVTAPPRAVVPPPFDWDRQVIQELHVRGFTMRHPAIPAEQRGTVAALGHPAVIGHLTALGITAIQLMPLAACIDERHLGPLGLRNYWGYNPVTCLAPDPRLAPGGWEEIRTAIAALHRAGIAVIVDIVLNHTGEGDALGPTLSLRGLDDALYYRRSADGAYVNDTGCGHMLALDRPPVWRLALDAMRAWATWGGVDGFRLDLATTLGRRDGGFDPGAPLLAAIAADPVLARRAIIAEPWDIGPGGYQLGAFPAAWGEWNDRYRDTTRRFWRGDGGMIGEMATRFAGSADIFAPRHRPLTRGINLITAHDGFTLADLVSHTRKHNAANGEDNRDGTDANLSWNNGVEGATADPAILAARARDARTMLATLLLSRGTPMLSMGDESGHSQGGNNNAYAQDNDTTWLDWAGMDTGLLAFTRRLIALRHHTPCLRGARPLTGEAVDGSSIPDVRWLSTAGTAMEERHWHDPDLRTLVAMLHARADTALVVLHAGAEATTITLPPAPDGQHWRVALDTADDARDGIVADAITAAARSVLLLRAEATHAGRAEQATSAALHDLANAAGIAASWWDIEGREHTVGDATRRVLLAAMGLPSATSGDVRDSLHRLTGPRALPGSLSVPVDQPAALRIPPPFRATWLTLAREDRTIDRIPVVDGQATLPRSAMGRHRLMLDDNPDTTCHLAVVPPHCFLPDDLAAGRRRFGIATHLYALRGEGDQGIGDFTTLAQCAAAASRAGAAVVGVNPLHALFPSDRSRASPYHPSHRGFLDPIYIDVGGLPGIDPDRRRTLSAAAMVDYPGVWGLKRRALWAAFAGEDAALDGFIAAGGTALRDFARFEAIAAVVGHTHWQTWPDGLRHPATAAVTAFAASHAREIRFICFMQMLADRQLGATARAAGLPIGLYRDLAIGCAPDGAEAWANQDGMLAGVSIGAPPDPFSATGQVWSLPPANPLRMAEDGFASFAALLAANMRHAGALRIDHVMGLRRLFLVPDGGSAADGTYLDFPFDHLLGQLALESMRARCLVVGEDLGTVPDGMRQRLEAARVLSYRVLWFERDGAAFRAPPAWPALAAACVSTHDLPTAVGWWRGADIAERRALGLIDPATDPQAERSAEKAALTALARAEGVLAEPATEDAAVAAMHGLIARTPCALALVQADDLAGEESAVNLPGTDRERANWRRRLRVPASALCDTPFAEPVLERMKEVGRST